MAATSNATSSASCGCCGMKHASSECWFHKEKCHACRKQGHIVKRCHSKKSTSTQVQPTRYISGGTTKELFSVYSIQKDLVFWVDVLLDGKKVKMEIDKGAAVSVLPENIYRDKFQQVQLKERRTTLKTYSGEQLPLLGVIHVPVEYQGQKENLPLVVVKGARPALLSRIG